MDEKVKVCFISLGSYPLFNPTCKQTFGGAEVQMYLIANELAKDRRFEVTFIVGDFGQADQEKHGKITVFKGIKSAKQSILSMFWPKSKIQLYRKMKRANADIYVQRTASAGTGLIRIFTWIRKRKFVYMAAHEIDCNGDFEKQNNLLVSNLYRLGIRYADSVISQNEEQRRQLNKYHETKSKVILSGYPISPLKETPRHGVLWVGRCEDWKRPDIYFRLAQQFPQQTFTFIAPKANQSDYYVKALKQMQETKNIEHVPYVPFDQIEKYFAKAQVFVNTSEHEGFPNTFIQAARCATPILSYKVNPNNFITSYDCGYFAHGSEDALAKGLKKLLNKRNWVKKSRNAYSYASENHNIVQNTEKIKELLISMTNKPDKS